MYGLYTIIFVFYRHASDEMHSHRHAYYNEERDAMVDDRSRYGYFGIPVFARGGKTVRHRHTSLRT